MRSLLWGCTIVVGITALVAFGAVVGWWAAFLLFVVLWANNAVLELSRYDEQEHEKRATRAFMQAVGANARNRIREMTNETKGEGP